VLFPPVDLPDDLELLLPRDDLPNDLLLLRGGGAALGPPFDGVTDLGAALGLVFDGVTGLGVALGPPFDGVTDLGAALGLVFDGVTGLRSELGLAFDGVTVRSESGFTFGCGVLGRCLDLEVTSLGDMRVSLIFPPDPEGDLALDGATGLVGSDFGGGALGRY
jgi:hypothetical protein